MTGERAKKIRMTVDFPEALLVRMREVAARDGKTATQVIKEAVALELYLSEVRREGGKLLVELPGKPLREVVLR